MKARIEHEIVRDSYKVWLWQPGPDFSVQVVGIDENGDFLLRNIPNGEIAEPSFRLPGMALKALAAEWSGILPPDRAMAEALTDAREVRDRLLALVEKRH